MLEEISAYPALQAEDDGFLLHVKDDFIAPHLPSLELFDDDSLLECIERLKKDNEAVAGVGASLPFYSPAYSDNGALCGYTYSVVWSGKRIDVPLYGDLCREQVEHLVEGNRIAPACPCDEFMSYSPAFRVALIVHHISQMVLINPMAAEAFVMGRYGELRLDDPHYEEWGVPSTEFVSVDYSHGLTFEWRASSPGEYMCGHGVEQHINGWNLRVRGAMPKREVFVEAWKETRDMLDAPQELDFTIGGKRMRHLAPAKGVGKRKRVGDPDVERMCRWVDMHLAKGTFPMRRTQKNWYEALVMLGEDCPDLAGRWKPDSMRKAYQHHKSLE